MAAALNILGVSFALKSASAFYNTGTAARPDLTANASVPTPPLQFKLVKPSSFLELEGTGEPTSAAQLHARLLKLIDRKSNAPLNSREQLLFQNYQHLIRPLAVTAINRTDAIFHTTLEDLEQEGFFGLVRGLRFYDPNQGTLEKFLRRGIYQAMRAFIDHSRLIGRLGEKNRTRGLEARKELRQHLKREPLAEEVAKFIGVDLLTYSLKFTSNTSRARAISLEQLLETIGDKALPLELMCRASSETKAIRAEHLAKVRTLRLNLSKENRKILDSYLQEIPLKEIGKMVGLTEATVTSRINRIKSQLRKAILNDEPLNESAS